MYTRAPHAVVHAAPVTCMIIGVYTGAVVHAVSVVVATPVRAGFVWLMRARRDKKIAGCCSVRRHSAMLAGMLRRSQGTPP